MLKKSDLFGLTRNLETLYSRRVIYSAFLLGSPTFSSATSSELTSTCYESTALCFHLHSEFAFQTSPTPACLLHPSVSCLCLSQLLQSSYCFNSRNLSLSAVLPLVCCCRISRKSYCSFFFSSLQDFIERKPAAGEKNIASAAGKFKGLPCLSFVLDYSSSPRLPFPSRFVCFFPVSMQVYVKTIPFELSPLFFPI